MTDRWKTFAVASAGAIVAAFLFTIIRAQWEYDKQSDADHAAIMKACSNLDMATGGKFKCW